jgi:hypothetical protein
MRLHEPNWAAKLLQEAKTSEPKQILLWTDAFNLNPSKKRLREIKDEPNIRNKRNKYKIARNMGHNLQKKNLE